MQKRDEILAEARELQEFVENADKVKAEREAELKAIEDSFDQVKATKEEEVKAIENSIVEMNQQYEVEKARLEEEAKRISMEQANEAMRLKEEADAERRAINEEKEAIIADIEQRRVDAQAELDQLVEQAKGVIAEAEEATKTRDEMIKVIEEAKALEAQKSEIEAEIAKKQSEFEAESAAKKSEFEAQIAEYEAQATEWSKQIESIKNEYEEAQRIIADSKNAEIQAEAIGQEIILNAEKQAVFLKEVSLSESEKGKMQKLIEEKEQQIKDMEAERDALLKEIESMKKSIADVEKKLKEVPSGGGTVAVHEGPKEYTVAVVPHNANGEVDNNGINKELESKSKDGWKLVSVINDEGGKLQASLGGAETSTLSSGVYTSKEDRVILIFERSKSI